MGLSNRRYIAANLESTAGTESAPTTSDVILCGSFNCTPLAGSVVERNITRSFFGKNQSITVESYVTIDFEVEVTGSPIATAPRYDKLLKACGFSSAVVSTSRVYLPITTDIPTLTFHFYMDGIKHVMVGAVGTVSFDFTVKKIPTMKFTFTGGLGVSAVTGGSVQPTGSYPTVVPLPFVTANVGQSIGFTSAADFIESITFDMANDVKYRTLIGSAQAMITGRSPKGMLRLQAVDATASTIFSAARLNTLSTVAITHGGAAGNSFKIESAAAQVSLDNPKYSSSDGIDMIDVGLSFTPTGSGNDEIKITVS